MEFRILGPVEVWHRGRLLDLGGSKPRALLALLLREPGRVVPADHLIDELWDAEPPAGARNAVQRHVSRLRRVLETEHGSPLLTRPPGYLLDVELEHVDMCRFEQLVEEGRSALDGGEPRQALGLLREALGLWRGPLLADVPASIRVAIAPRLGETRLTAMEERIEAELRLGRHEAVIKDLRELAETYPTRERFVGQLMVALYRCGRQAEAVEVYQHARQRYVDELGLEPSATLRRLQEAVLQDDPSLGLTVRPAGGVVSRRRPAAALGNLVRPRTSFVGREREQAEVTELLAEQPLVSLVGPPGGGKTRLALEVGAALLGEYPDGAWVVELDTTSDPALVAHTVAGTLDIQDDPRRPPAEAVVEALADWRALLVLDNCEHLVEECARLVDALLDRCPGLRILATSREPLEVAGETVCSVAPLRTPEPDHESVERVRAAEAARLFVDRAVAVQPAFALTEDNASAVAKVCRSLDGLPLAIELAAARLRVLSVEQIAARIDQQLGLLVTRRGLPTRQQSLRAAFDWSYELLGPAERLLFARLSVFAGGFTLEAAETACAGSGVRPAEVLDVLRDLVDRSLVVGESREAGMRFRMLEALRQYAAERLAQEGDVDALRARHADFFAGLAERAERERRGTARPQWRATVYAEYANLRAALGWARESGNHEISLRLVGTLWWHWLDHPSEGLRWARAALEAASEAPEVPARPLQRALFTSGYLGFRSQAGEAMSRLEESLALARKLGDRAAMVPVLVVLGSLALDRGRADVARGCHDQALDITRELGDDYGTARVLLALGNGALHAGDLARAEGHLREARELFHAFGDEYGIAEAEQILGQAAFHGGDLERARVLIRGAMPRLQLLETSDRARAKLYLSRVAADEGRRGEALDLLDEALHQYADLREFRYLAVVFECFAALAYADGDAERAATLLGAAERVRTDADLQIPPIERDGHQRLRAGLAAALGEDGLAAGLDQGLLLSLEEAVSVRHELAP